MTEEEIKLLAREYINNCTKRAGFVILAEGLINDFIDLFVAGFMKCLELNKRDKWHKIADGDYPPMEKGSYTINVLTDRGDVAYYSYDDECWVAEPSSTEIDTPEAWCELPKYTKENI